MSYVTPDGKRHRASTGKHYHEEAKAVRDRIAGDLASGRAVTPPGKLTFADLCELIRTDYRVRGRRSLPTLETTLKQLTEFFGARKPSSITWSDAQAYRVKLEGQGRKPATVNKHLAALRRMLRLAVKDSMLAAVPPIECPDPKNARQGFVDRDDLDSVLEHLPEAYRGPVLFAYLTGWRTRSEVLSLRWSQLDERAGMVRLEPNTTKNSQGRTFPFGVLPELKALIDAQRRTAQPGVPYVFPEAGGPISYWRLRTAWERACEASEVRHVLHDLRRSAVRNLERAGVARSVAMKLTGHETESVYKRYAIAAERDLSEGVEKLARVTLASHSTGS